MEDENLEDHASETMANQDRPKHSWFRKLKKKLTLGGKKTSNESTDRPVL